MGAAVRFAVSSKSMQWPICQRYVKAFARRSVAYEELQKWHDAFEDLKKAVELDPSLRTKDSWQRVGKFLVFSHPTCERSGF